MSYEIQKLEEELKDNFHQVEKKYQQQQENLMAQNYYMNNCFEELAMNLRQALQGEDDEFTIQGLNSINVSQDIWYEHFRRQQARLQSEFEQEQDEYYRNLKKLYDEEQS
ncbi:hypothetical protein ACWCL1_07450 [Ligilactobacillus sp. LYQ135]